MDMDGHGWTIDCCWTQIHHGDTNTGHCQFYPVFTADLSMFNHLMELSKAPMRFGQLSLQFEQWLWKRPPYILFMSDHLQNDSTVFWLSFQNVHASLSTA